MLIEQFQKVFSENTVKDNSLQKITDINSKLVVRKYERGCMYSQKKKTCSLGLNFGGKFVIKH